MIKEYIIKKIGKHVQLEFNWLFRQDSTKVKQKFWRKFKTFDWDVITNEFLTNAPILMPVLRVHENQ